MRPENNVLGGPPTDRKSKGVQVLTLKLRYAQKQEYDVPQCTAFVARIPNQEYTVTNAILKGPTYSKPASIV